MESTPKLSAYVEEKNSAGIRLFSYNSHHQQTTVETENGSVQENRYDAEGLRFELLENGRKTSFVYHNGELLHEEGGIGQALSGQTSYHLGAGIDALQRGQDLSYYHRDEQLSTAFITGSAGEIQNSYLYDAFGNELDADEQFQNRIRYTGQQYDDLTEQYYLRARYYNPVLGRFLQEDVYQGDGLNLYAYCRNNPVMYWDPSGYDSNINIEVVLEYFNQHSNNPLEIFSTNNSWNSFRHIVGGQGFSNEQIRAAYNTFLRDNANGHYIRRNNLSRTEIAQILENYVVGTSGLSLSQAKAQDIQIDIGHKSGWEFWRTRNAAENLGWTQAQYDDFMTSDVTAHYQYEEHIHNITHIDEVTDSDVSGIEAAMLKYQKEQEELGNWKREDNFNDQNSQSGC